MELFTGPGVSDAARADLKKEMTKKGVRKTILDSVLSKVLAASSADSAPPSREGSENGDAMVAKKEYVPPSLMLQGKRPRTNSQSRTFTPMATLPRTTSYSGSIKDSSRPQSRAGATTPPTTVLSPLNDNAEVQIVFVSKALTAFNSCICMLKPCRLPPVVTLKMSSYPWPSPSKYVFFKNKHTLFSNLLSPPG